MKTDNLLVNNHWVTKVADFGISTVKPTITRAMTCIGTPGNIIFNIPIFTFELISNNTFSLYGTRSTF